MALRLARCLGAVVLIVASATLTASALAQPVLFDFDNAPAFTPFPLDVTAGGITAHLSATGQGYSIQHANTMGFTPVGFAGNCIYPSSVFASDLHIGLSRVVQGVSIMYAPQELGCDASALMRITAFKGGSSVGTATTTAPFPGTWPTGVLSITVPTGLDSVVVHYDTKPACGDWGPIFLADNMIVTAEMVYGDLNLDGSPDVFDVVILANAIVGNLSPGVAPFLGTLAAGDCKADGTIDVFDVVILAAYLVGNVPSLPQ